MASIMAAYLTASGGDPRAPGGGQPKPKSPPASVGAAAPGSAGREVPPLRAQAPDPKPSAPPAPPSRVRPGTAAVTEAKPSPPPGAPVRPVLEDFEE